MRNIVAATALLVLGFLVMTTSPAEAQATRTWVSGVGDDVNPCSRTAPCKTFAGAISKTATNGEINCLDPAGYGAVTITKSITIDCHEIFASILHSSTNGVNISFNSFQPTDVRKTVRLRNLNFNGANSGLVGVSITGGTVTGGSVFIEDCLLDGNFSGNARGIQDLRSGGGELSVSNTTVRNMLGSGIVVLPATGGTRIDVVLDNVRVQNANFGAAFNSGNRAMVNRSVFSGNTSAGIQVEGPAGAAEVNINNSVLSNNGTGLSVLAGGTARISNNDISFNGTGISGASSSFGNNRISGNTAPGTAPTPIGGDSHDKGQQ